MSMPQPMLSILIPTVMGREKDFNRLKKRLSEMAEGLPPTLIEVQVALDDKKMTIGEKRERLYKMANGIYSWQIDDDDDIDPESFKLILQAIGQDPDCITFEEYCLMDGKEYKSNHSLSYPGWVGDGQQLLSDGFHFWRTPFFKSVIKTEIAKSVSIPHERFGEDNMFADALKDKLKTEVHISRQLYRYIHNSTPFHERYGFDKD